MEAGEGRDTGAGGAPAAAEAAVVTVPRWRAVRRLWRAQTIYVVALASFAVLVIFVYLDKDHYFGWDYRVSHAFNWKTFTPPGLFRLMVLASYFGNGWTPYIMSGLAAGAFLLFRRNSEAAALLVSTAGSGLINSAFKLLIARPRPAPDLIPGFTDPVTNSFPSGHVTFYVCFFGFLFFTAFALLRRGTLLRRLALIVTGLPVLLVGLSRIYLGAHWPSDTLGAYLWSGVWLGFSLWLYRRWKQTRAMHPEEVISSQ